MFDETILSRASNPSVSSVCGRGRSCRRCGVRGGCKDGGMAVQGAAGGRWKCDARCKSDVKRCAARAGW
eukprot:4164723-Prymnesium_polylepis.1